MERGKPLISIITAAYNAEAHLKSCIENVQQQTYRSFEHLIIEGQSTDSTLFIAQTAASNYKNLIVASQKDSGVYDALNIGIEKCKGEWVYFLGADDYFITEDVLVQVEKVLIQSTSRIIYGDAWVEKYKRLYDGEFDIEKILRHNVCHQAVFYHRSIFDEMGFYQLKYKQEADYVFNLHCWLSCKYAPQYIPLAIAFFKDGGVSSPARDTTVVKDYPSIVVQDILSSSAGLFSKIHMLSIALRKIMLRYKPIVIFQLLLRSVQNLFFIPISSVWMLIEIMIRLGSKTVKK